MHLIYCTYGTEVGKKEGSLTPEQPENTEVQHRAKHCIGAFLVREAKAADNTEGRCIALWAVLYTSFRLLFIYLFVCLFILVTANPPIDCCCAVGGTCGKRTGWANSRKFDKPVWLSFHWALQHLPAHLMKPVPKWGEIILCSSLCAFLGMERGTRTTARVSGCGERCGEKIC